MAVTFRIGEAAKIQTTLNDKPYEYWDVRHEIIFQEDAPQFPGRMDGTNVFHCNNSTMLSFAFQFSQLSFLVSGNRMVCINQSLLDELDLCFREHIRLPGYPPGFVAYGERTDLALAILIWLRWWCNWAAKNCSVPILCF